VVECDAVLCARAHSCFARDLPPPRRCYPRRKSAPSATLPCHSIPSAAWDRDKESNAREMHGQLLFRFLFLLLESPTL
jgi:hypothetical protein